MADFEETQSFSPVLLAIVGAVIAVSLVPLVFSGEAAAGPRLWAGPAIATAIFFAIASMRLRTKVSSAGVEVKGLIFIDRLISFAEIETAEAVTYRPLLDHGGWGYRLGAKGKAYNMRGNRGVALVLADGGRVLIGSQRANDLAAAINARL